MVKKRNQKIETQIVDAIRNLQAAQGSTQREICNYISQEYNLPGADVRRQVQVALKQGVTYGLLQRLKGGYYTYNQQLFNANPVGTYVTIPWNGQRRRRRSSWCRSCRRKRAKRRQQRSRRDRRQSSKEEDDSKETDGSGMKTLTKQSKRSSSLLEKDAPESEVSSIAGKSDETRE